MAGEAKTKTVEADTEISIPGPVEITSYRAVGGFEGACVIRCNDEVLLAFTVGNDATVELESPLSVASNKAAVLGVGASLHVHVTDVVGVEFTYTKKKVRAVNSGDFMIEQWVEGFQLDEPLTISSEQNDDVAEALIVNDIIGNEGCSLFIKKMPGFWIPVSLKKKQIRDAIGEDEIRSTEKAERVLRSLQQGGTYRIIVVKRMQSVKVVQTVESSTITRPPKQ